MLTLDYTNMNNYHRDPMLVFMPQIDCISYDKFVTDVYNFHSVNYLEQEPHC